jgi:hypothetical protein
MDPEFLSQVAQAKDLLSTKIYSQEEFQDVIANLKQEAAARSRVRLAELGAKEEMAKKESALHREAAAHPNIITSSHDVLLASKAFRDHQLGLQGQPGDALPTHV